MLALCLVALLGLIVWWLLSANRITQRSYDAIEAGMTLAQVEEIFGGPAIDLRRGWQGVEGPLEFSAPVGQIRIWSSGQDRFVIGFDHSGQVTAKLRRRVDFSTAVRSWLRSFERD